MDCNCGGFATTTVEIVRGTADAKKYTDKPIERFPSRIKIIRCPSCLRYEVKIDFWGDSEVEKPKSVNLLALLRGKKNV